MKMSCFFVVAALLLVAVSARTSIHKGKEGALKDASQYVVLGDVGSSGTDMFVYAVDNLDADPVCVISGKKAWTKCVKGSKVVGEARTSQLVKYPEENVGDFWSNFMTLAAGGFDGGKCEGKPSSLLKCFPETDSDFVENWLKEVKYQFFATAGMREEQTENFERLSAAAAELDYPNVKGNVIAGALEGMFGMLSNTPDVNDRKTTVYIETGGASGQIAFQCPATACPDAPSFLETGADSKVDGYVTSGTNGDCYYSTSFMGYGSDQLWAIVLNELGASKDHNAESCIQKGMTIEAPIGAPWTVSNQKGDSSNQFPFCAEGNYVGKAFGVSKKRTFVNENSCQASLDGCRAAIKSVSEEEGNELRGFSNSSVPSGPVSELRAHWTLVLDALTACNVGEFKKTEFLAKGHFTSFGSKKKQSLNHAKRLEAETSWVCDNWDTADNIQFDAKKPLMATMINYFVDKMNNHLGDEDLPLTVPASAADWVVEGHKYVIRAGSFTHPDGSDAEKFIFGNDAVDGWTDPEDRPATYTREE